eukprot:3848660-Rhodomonas_salina.1
MSWYQQRRGGSTRQAVLGLGPPIALRRITMSSESSSSSTAIAVVAGMGIAAGVGAAAFLIGQKVGTLTAAEEFLLCSDCFGSALLQNKLLHAFLAAPR